MAFIIHNKKYSSLLIYAWRNGGFISISAETYLGGFRNQVRFAFSKRVNTAINRQPL